MDLIRKLSVIREEAHQKKQDTAPSPLMDLLADRVARRSPKARSEIERICSVPLSFPPSEEEVAYANMKHVKAEAARDENFKLLYSQAWAFLDYEQYGNIFCPIEVGGGKTMITLRIASIAYEEDHSRILLIVPPNVFAQLAGGDINWCRKRVPLSCPFVLLAGKTPSDRISLARAKHRGCFILTYSLLSARDASQILDLVKPTFINLDEAHNVKDRSTTRTKRLMRYLESNAAKVMPLSGTMTAKSIRDYGHLIRASLGDKSPLPLDYNNMNEWCNLLDSGASISFTKDTKASAGPLRPLINWSRKNFPEHDIEYNIEGFRQAYQNRLLTTPGVISSPVDSIGASLIFNNARVPIPSTEQGVYLTRLMDDLEKLWMAPNGDEIEHAIMKFKWQVELSAGIYNNLIWPEPEDYAKSKGIPLMEAEELIENAKLHHAARQEYHRELRRWLQNHEIDGIDTPLLVANNMSRHKDKVVGPSLYAAWRYMKDLEFEDMPERKKVPVRVCDYKLRAAIEWAKTQKQGIIWYMNQEVGKWMAELGKEQGLPIVFCPAGNTANTFLTDGGRDEAAKRCKGKILVCSVRAHGTGKNLQFMSEQFFLQFPRSEVQCQQTIGRTHRNGQLEDEVNSQLCISTPTDHVSLAATLNDAIYNAETIGSQRKVLIGTWNPMPVTQGSELLIRAGTQAKRLNQRQQKTLNERFQSA